MTKHYAFQCTSLHNFDQLFVFFQQNSYPICVVSDDVIKSVEVRYRKARKLLAIYPLSFDSLVDLHFRVQTVFIQFLTL